MPLSGFDNDFFGIDLEEAQAISPSQRWVMEVGYEVGRTGGRVTGGNGGWEPSSHPWEVLWKAGWTKAGLRGQRIGSFMGDSGSEWNYIYLKQDRYQFPGQKNLKNNRKNQQGGFGAEKKTDGCVCLQFLGCRTF